MSGVYRVFQETMSRGWCTVASAYRLKWLIRSFTPACRSIETIAQIFSIKLIISHTSLRIPHRTKFNKWGTKQKNRIWRLNQNQKFRVPTIWGGEILIWHSNLTGNFHIKPTMVPSKKLHKLHHSVNFTPKYFV